MASKSPLNKIQDTVVGTVKAVVADPVGTARGTVALGKAVAGQVGKSAAGAVAGRLGHGAGVDPAQPTPPAEDRAPVEPTPISSKAPATKAPAKKAPAKKAPAKKAPAKKAPAATTTPVTPTKAPVTDLATELVKKQAAHQTPPPAPSAPENPIDAAADPAHVDATPSDVAKKAAKKAPAKKATAKKTPAKKAAATKTPATKTSSPSGKLPTKKAPGTPKTAAEVLEDADLPTPIESIGSSTPQD